MPIDFYQLLVAMGIGTMLGDMMLMGWKIMNPYERFVSDFINLWVNVRDAKSLERSKKFQTWYEYTQNISGRWYLQAVEKLFKKNLLIQGKLKILGKYVDRAPSRVPSPCLQGKRTILPWCRSFSI